MLQLESADVRDRVKVHLIDRTAAGDRGAPELPTGDPPQHLGDGGVRRHGLGRRRKIRTEKRAIGASDLHRAGT